jgi:transposase
MSEIKKITILEELKKGRIQQREAGLRMEIGVRQVQRLAKRYTEFGPAGIVHKSFGKPSGRAMPKEKKAKIVRLIQTHYDDFGPVLASEMLDARHDIKIHKEQVRRLMLEAGIWQPRKSRAKHKTWRLPKKYRGEMVQLDVSYHQWFEDRAGWGYLVKFVDDATKEILYAKFISGESYHDVALATIEYFILHGLPQSLYTDKGKVFKVNFGNKNDKRKTQYEQALEIVSVQIIHAHSPQAKGRVERSFQTDQDRLVKMLRLENISTIDAANTYLHETYIPMYNKKFTRPPACSGDLHTHLRSVNLYDVFCIRETRTVQNDWTLRYRNRILQITKNQQAVIRPKDTITISERLDGSLYLELRSFKVNFKEVNKLPEKTYQPKPANAIKRPVKNHPWRTFKNRPYQPPKRDISTVSKQATF